MKTTRNTNHEGHVTGLASADRVSDAPCGRCAMRPDAAALLLLGKKAGGGDPWDRPADLPRNTARPTQS